MADVCVCVWDEEDIDCVGLAYGSSYIDLRNADPYRVEPAIKRVVIGDASTDAGGPNSTDTPCARRQVQLQLQPQPYPAKKHGSHANEWQREQPLQVRAQLL